MLEQQPRYHGEIAGLCGGEFPSVTLHDADDDVGAPARSAPALGQHRDGLAHPRRGAQVDPEPAPLPGDGGAGRRTALGSGPALSLIGDHDSIIHQVVNESAAVDHQF